MWNSMSLGGLLLIGFICVMAEIYDGWVYLPYAQ